MKKRHKTSFTLSAEAVALLRALAVRLGVSQAAVVEMSVRKLAAAEGVGPLDAEDQT